MKLRPLPNLLSLFAISALVGVCDLSAAPPVIDDLKLITGLIKATGESVGKEGVANADDLCKKFKAKEGGVLKLDQPLPQNPTPARADYETLSKSVYLIDSIYKCGKCDKWHQGSAATAWCLSEDGLMVTNAHVFRNVKGAAMGLTNREGQTFQVSELLAFDESADVAVFRVNGKGMQPLRVGEAAAVGDPLSIISNPSGNLFVRTEGAVSRYSMRPMKEKLPKVPWMEVTADYAVGSSGGPVFNAAGEVVGMVSSTRSIHTGGSAAKGAQKGDLQMVIKNCVPVDAIRALFTK